MISKRRMRICRWTGNYRYHMTPYFTKTGNSPKWRVGLAKRGTSTLPMTSGQYCQSTRSKWSFSITLMMTVYHNCTSLLIACKCAVCTRCPCGADTPPGHA